MSNWSLLRVMLLKEVRTTFRERAQLRGLAISVLLLMLIGGNALFQTRRVTRRSQPSTIHRVEQPGGQSPEQTAMIRWIAIGASAGIGFFFSTGYLMAAVLACFVGEKEAKTLEILLAAPLSDDKLFFMKATSVLLPSACLGSIFAAGFVLLGAVFLPTQYARMPTRLLVYAPVLGIGAMVLLQCWFVGLGAAISAKAETMKGAGQTLGAMFMVMFFGGGYGLPLLFQAFPPLRTPLAEGIRKWTALPFAGQYGMLILMLGIPAVIFLGVGRAFFRRDRMLT
jgi:ABC-type transport system involved in multi-copper enzyme maturation permease subunit